MTDPLVPAADGHTPLDEDDREGLRLTYITTRGELYDAEQANMLRALAARRRPNIKRLLDDQYLRRLHKAMFEEVWTWAGQYRLRETTFGFDPTIISASVRDLVADAQTWVQHGTYERDELAVRFHHQLVVIHPFRNGNGRHTRVCADYLVQALGAKRFTWGALSEGTTEEIRGRYIAALRRADREDDFGELIAFART